MEVEHASAKPVRGRGARTQTLYAWSEPSVASKPPHQKQPMVQPTIVKSRTPRSHSAYGTQTAMQQVSKLMKWCSEHGGFLPTRHSCPALHYFLMKQRCQYLSPAGIAPSVLSSLRSIPAMTAALKKWETARTCKQVKERKAQKMVRRVMKQELGGIGNDIEKVIKEELGGLKQVISSTSVVTAGASAVSAGAPYSTPACCRQALQRSLQSRVDLAEKVFGTSVRPLKGDNQNDAYLCFSVDSEDDIYAIWKPMNGEKVDRYGFKNGDGALREESAFVLSSLLDLENVPVTTRIAMNGDFGSCQEWKAAVDLEKYQCTPTVLAQIDQCSAENQAMIDIVTGQTDRHWTNLMVTPSAQLVAVDNSLGFPPFYALHCNFEAWLGLPQLQGAPSTHVVQKVLEIRSKLDGCCDALAAMGMPPVSIETFVLLVRFMETAVLVFNLPLASIGRLLVRDFDHDKGIERLSWFQRLMLASPLSGLSLQLDHRGDEILQPGKLSIVDNMNETTVRQHLWQQFPEAYMSLTLDKSVTEMGLTLTPPRGVVQVISVVAGGWAAGQGIYAGCVLQRAGGVLVAALEAAALEEACCQRPLHLVFSRAAQISSLGVV